MVGQSSPKCLPELRAHNKINQQYIELCIKLPRLYHPQNLVPQDTNKPLGLKNNWQSPALTIINEGKNVCMPTHSQQR